MKPHGGMKKRILYVYKLLLDLVLVLVAIAAIWQAAKLGSQALVYLIKLAAVTVALALGVYATAKAERGLPRRDLALDFDGDSGQADRFNTIVRDRIRRTRVAA